MRLLGNQRNNMPIVSTEADNRPKIVALSAPTYTRLGSINAALRTASNINFHPDGSIIAVAAYDDVALFDTKTLQPVIRFKTPTQGIRRVLFGQNGATLAIGGSSFFSLLSPQ